MGKDGTLETDRSHIFPINQIIFVLRWTELKSVAGIRLAVINLACLIQQPHMNARIKSFSVMWCV